MCSITNRPWGREDLLPPCGNFRLAVNEIMRLQSKAAVTVEHAAIDRFRRLETKARRDYAGVSENLELAIRYIRRRDDAAAEALRLSAERVEHVLVGKTVLKRLNDQAPGESQGIVHRDEIVDRTIFDFKPPPGAQRKTALRSEDMEMGIAAPGREFQPRFLGVSDWWRRFNVRHANSRCD